MQREDPAWCCAGLVVVIGGCDYNDTTYGQWSARSAEYRESWLSSRADTWGEGDAGVNMDPGPVGVEGLG